MVACSLTAGLLGPPAEVGLGDQASQLLVLPFRAVDQMLHADGDILARSEKGREEDDVADVAAGDAELRGP